MNLTLLITSLILFLGISFPGISGRKTFHLSREHSRKRKQIVYKETSNKKSEKQIEHFIDKGGHVDFVEGCSTDCNTKVRKNRRKNKHQQRKSRRKGNSKRRKQRRNGTGRRKINSKLPRDRGFHNKASNKAESRPVRVHAKSQLFSGLEYPSNVERLEYRLRPTPVVPLKKFYHLANDVIRKVKQHMRRSHGVYNYTFNAMRYDFVQDLRKVIKKIHNVNDIAYGVVLNASQIIKRIYIRAHNGHLTGPSTASLSRPENFFADLTNPMYQSDAEYRTSQDIYSKSKQMLWDAERINKGVAMMTDFVDLAPLQDLMKRSHQVLYKLNHDLMISQLQAKFRDQKYVKASIKECEKYLTDSRSDIVAVFDALMEAKNIHQSNVRYKAEVLKKKGHHPSRVTTKVPSSITDSEYKRLVLLISQAKNHADDLSNSRKYIEINLLPALTAAKKVKPNSARPHDDKLYVYRVTKKLEGDIKRLVIFMDNLRLFIGDIEGIKQRCEEIEGSGYGPMPDSILDCDQYIEEGSGHNFTELTVENATVTEMDNDFVFIDGEDKKPEPSTSSTKTLGEKLETYSANVKNNSEVILTKAQAVHQRIFDASTTWRITKNELTNIQTNNNNITRTLSKVKSEQGEIKRIKAAIPEILLGIDHQLNTTLSESLKANITIERKLAELKSKNGKNKEKPKKENVADVAEAKEEVGKVKSNVEKIKSLKSVLPDSCKRIQDTKNSIQLNISELRNKIEKFRTISSNLQMPRSLSGEEYLTLPVLQKQAPALVSSFELCIKPADVDTDTVVAMVQQNNSLSFTVGIDDGEPELTVYNADGYNLDTIYLNDIELENNQWYKLSVTREGKRYFFSCQHLDSTDTNDSKDKIINSVPLNQPAPLDIRIGGFESVKEIDAPDEYWKGCVSEVKWNQELIDVFVSSNKEDLPQVCSDDCPRKKQPSIVFKGNGFMHYSISKVTDGERIQSFGLKFRTWQEKATIAAVINKRQRIQIVIEIDNGTVLIEYRGRLQYSIKTQQEHFNNGEFHSIFLQDIDRDDSGKNVLIDGEKDYSVSRARIDLENIEDGIYIGGIVSNNKLQVNDKFRPFSGCMRHIKVNKKVLSLEEASRTHRVHFGTCNATNVDNCVSFTQGSPNISFPEQKNDPPYVMIIFSSEARGHIMNYKRFGKYNFELIMNDDGLQLYQSNEKTEPDTETIPVTGTKSAWRVLTVRDDKDGQVIISLAGQSREFEYEGDGWFGGDKRYKVSIGGQGEDNPEHFTGEIMKLLIDYKSVNLKEYMHSHDLRTCTQKVPTSQGNIDLPPVTTLTTTTTTESPDDPLQCS